jgi:NAD(P)-dependent dehydrogenase (short-subunit alcohol dehydrogenase family)
VTRRRLSSRYTDPTARRELSWSPDQIPDLTGCTAVVTGANSGLGYYTARELLRSGAHVVLACRDTARAEQALNRMRGQLRAARATAGPGPVGGGTLPVVRDQRDAGAEIRQVDLSDLASVRRFAAALAGQRDRLELLVNNAGVTAIPAGTSADGYELQLATNHLGPFALTGLLLPLLILGAPESGQPRVVTVSSLVHRSGRLDRDDLMLERGYTPFRSYCRSKLANLLFMLQLQRRLASAGAPVASLACHPGYAATNLQPAGPALPGHRWIARAMSLGNRLFAQSAEQGAWPSLRAATDPDACGGEFFGPGGYGGTRGRPIRVSMSARAADPDDAAWLWDRSVELTGVDYHELTPATPA